MSDLFYSCPKCHTEDISADHMENEGGTAWRIVRCQNDECGYTWQEVFEFTHNETPDTCENIDENGDVI